MKEVFVSFSKNFLSNNTVRERSSLLSQETDEQNYTEAYLYCFEGGADIKVMIIIHN